VAARLDEFRAARVEQRSAIDRSMRQLPYPSTALQQILAANLGPSVISNPAYVFERWDGNGFPGAAAGEPLGPPARVLHVGRDISVFLSAGGPDRARHVIEQRAGGAYDPRLAALATGHFDQLLDGLDDAVIWEQAIAADPPPQQWMTGEEIDAAFRVVGTFTGLKSYCLVRACASTRVDPEKDNPPKNPLARMSREVCAARWRRSAAWRSRLSSRSR
jgi:hypothetical protein